MISGCAHLVTKPKSRKPVGAEIRGKKVQVRGKWLEREEGKSSVCYSLSRFNRNNVLNKRGDYSTNLSISK